MPITLQWYNAEKTILYERFQGQITLRDYQNLVDDAAALLAERQETIHILADFTETGITQLPRNLLAVLQYASERIPANQGIAVFIKPGITINRIINIAKRANLPTVKKLFIADTVEEAEQIISEKTAGVS